MELEVSAGDPVRVHSLEGPTKWRNGEYGCAVEKNEEDAWTVKFKDGKSCLAQSCQLRVRLPVADLLGLFRETMRDRMPVEIRDLLQNYLPAGLFAEKQAHLLLKTAFQACAEAVHMPDGRRWPLMWPSHDMTGGSTMMHCLYNTVVFEQLAKEFDAFMAGDERPVNLESVGLGHLKLAPGEWMMMGLVKEYKFADDVSRADGGSSSKVESIMHLVKGLLEERHETGDGHPMIVLNINRENLEEEAGAG